MKRTISIILFALISCFYVAAQQQDFAKFLIRNAYLKGGDYSDYYRKSGAYLVLYDDDDDMCMAIVMGKKDSQSYGVVTNAEGHRYEETPTSYAKDVVKFLWHYENSYDDKKGVATCRLEIRYTEKGPLFDFEYVLSNGETAKYSGMMEGALKF